MEKWPAPGALIIEGFIKTTTFINPVIIDSSPPFISICPSPSLGFSFLPVLLLSQPSGFSGSARPKPPFAGDKPHPGAISAFTGPDGCAVFDVI
jgi:hypothetical protein